MNSLIKQQRINSGRNTLLKRMGWVNGSFAPRLYHEGHSICPGSAGTEEKGEAHIMTHRYVY